MKQSITLEDSELSKTIIRALEEPVEKLVNNLVEGYQDSLIQNGYYIPASDIEALKKFLRGDMTVKLTLTASITEKKLDDWHMSAIKATQSFLETVPETLSDSTVTISANGKDGTALSMDQFNRLPEFIEKNAKSLVDEDEAFREERKRREEAQV